MRVGLRVLPVDWKQKGRKAFTRAQKDPEQTFNLAKHQITTIEFQQVTESECFAANELGDAAEAVQRNKRKQPGIDP